MASPSTPAPQFTVADLASINSAIASGATEVRFQDRTIRYRSMQDMLIARNLIYQYLYPNTTTRQTRIATTQGFNGC